MIKPPGQSFGRGVFEIHDGIFVAVKHLHIEKRARTMKQSCVLNISLRVDPFLVKAREGGGGSDAVKAVTVIKQTKSHEVVLSNPLGGIKARNLSNERSFAQR